MYTNPADAAATYAHTRRRVALDVAPTAAPRRSRRTLDRTLRWLIERLRAMRVDRSQWHHPPTTAGRRHRPGARPIARTELDTYY